MHSVIILYLLLSFKNIYKSIYIYHPINNLSAIDKIIEQFLKEQLNDSINDNNIKLNDYTFLPILHLWFLKINGTKFDVFDDNIEPHEGFDSLRYTEI